MTINLPQRFVIATHPSRTSLVEGIHTFVNHLKNAGAKQVDTYTINDPELKRIVEAREIDVLIALGGDGTILRASHLVAPVGIPLLGINRGRFGFLMEVEEDECEQRFNQLIQGDFHFENRMMLRARHFRQEQLLGEWHVLNEVILCRGNVVRPIQVKAHMDGYLIASYVADGVIASTATGSTAYALAVGGPIMPPELRNILIVPVAPHLSMSQSIILSEGDQVNLTVKTSHEVVISADGQYPVHLQNKDEIAIDASNYTIRFIRFRDRGYFYRNLHKYMEQNPIAGEL